MDSQLKHLVKSVTYIWDVITVMQISLQVIPSIDGSDFHGRAKGIFKNVWKVSPEITTQASRIELRSLQNAPTYICFIVNLQEGFHKMSAQTSLSS